MTKSDQFCDTVCTEWLLYATGTALESAVDQFPNNICAYWLHVSSMVDTVGEKKYKVILLKQHLHSYIAMHLLNGGFR